MEKKLTEALKKFNLLTSIKKKSLDEVVADLSEEVDDTPQKKLFIDTINILEEIEERSGELFEAGIDLSLYETLFFQVIENLFYTIQRKTSKCYPFLYLWCTFIRQNTSTCK